MASAPQIAKISNTKSGKFEITINTDDVGKVKSLIIADTVNYGYEITKDSQYHLEMVRPTKQEEDFSAVLIASNSYSSNLRVALYTLLKVNNRIEVIVSAFEGEKTSPRPI